MPRHARKLSSIGLYHIMLRGINQQQILEDKEDNEKFIEILKDCKLITDISCMHIVLWEIISI